MMKTTRIAVYAAAVIALFFALAMISGCGGGSKRQSIITPFRGSLQGVATIPGDIDVGIEDTNVPVNAWIRVYWPTDGYPPPREFTVRVEKEQSPDVWGGIHTKLSALDSDPQNGSWWFEPVSEFSPFTWYRIIIRAAGENPVYVYFKTNDTHELSLTRSVSATKLYRPARSGSADGEDSVEHTIKR